MRYLLVALVVLGLFVGGWYGAWSSGMRPHLVRVNATIAYYNEQFKTSSYRATFKADSVHAGGFPFKKKIIIDHPNLAMVWGNETYMIESEHIELVFEDKAQGRYRVMFPDAIRAMYAEAGKAPEAYTVKLQDIPLLWARVQDTSPMCRGDTCQAMPEAVLTQIGFQPPGMILIEASLGGKSEKIGFKMIALPKPLFMDIPRDPSYPVSIFVDMLRQALVFRNQ